MPSEKRFDLLAVLREADGRVAELESDNNFLRNVNCLLIYVLVCALIALGLVLKH